WRGSREKSMPPPKEIAMARWLMKSEPHVYSWDDLVRDGGTEWDGVRNNAARLHLRAMKVDDEAFFYHSGEERAGHPEGHQGRAQAGEDGADPPVAPVGGAGARRGMGAGARHGRDQMTPRAAAAALLLALTGAAPAQSPVWPL